MGTAMIGSLVSSKFLHMLPQSAATTPTITRQLNWTKCHTMIKSCTMRISSHSFKEYPTMIIITCKVIKKCPTISSISNIKFTLVLCKHWPCLYFSRLLVLVDWSECKTLVFVYQSIHAMDFLSQSSFHRHYKTDCFCRFWEVIHIVFTQYIKSVAETLKYSVLT